MKQAQRRLTFSLSFFARTEYFHIKDVIAKTGELVPAGYGDGKIEKLIGGLETRNVVLSIEPHLAVFKGYADIDGTEMKNKFQFKSNEEAFDAAVSALKKLLLKAGYREADSVFPSSHSFRQTKNSVSAASFFTFLYASPFLKIRQ